MKRALMFPVLFTLMLSGQASALQCQAGHSRVSIESAREHPRPRVELDVDTSTTDYVLNLRGQSGLTREELERAYRLGSARLFVGYKNRDPVAMTFTGKKTGSDGTCLLFSAWEAHRLSRGGLSRVGGNGPAAAPKVCLSADDNVTATLVVDVNTLVRPLGGPWMKPEDFFIQVLVSNEDDEDDAIIDFPHNNGCKS